MIVHKPVVLFSFFIDVYCFETGPVSVAQATLELIVAPASAFQVLGL